MVTEQTMQLAGTDVPFSSEAEERAALERCHRGDTEAFGVMVNRNMKRAYFTALGLVGNHADALDLSQEAFVRAFRAMPRFDVNRKFFTWYYQILRNLCLNHLRRRNRHGEVNATENSQDSESTPPSPAHDIADPAVLADRSELAVAVWRAVAQLKPEAREVFLLREVEGCSYAEMAERLGVPQGTVMSRLYYARQELKESLGQWL